MIKKITNFVNYENKGYFEENGLQAIRFWNNHSKDFEWERKTLERLLSYFDKLISTYPEVLTDEQIKKDSERLIAYCKENGFAYKDTYPYIHKETIGKNGIIGATIGLRVSNVNYYNKNCYTGENIVDIAYYDYNSSEVFVKQKLRFVLNKDSSIRWKHFIHEDCCISHLYESDTLERLKPSIYIKKIR